MGERLRAKDLAFLTAETPTAPRHNATVEIFEAASTGFGHDALTELVGDRIAFVPRYRQRVRHVPGRLANPVWLDDPHFDLAYHVRRSALPQPGGMEQLCELVARIVSRPLDRNRPLWEVYVVEGLQGGRVAVLTKAHQALVDGAQVVDLAQVLLDRTPEQRQLGSDEWRAERVQSPAGLLADAVRETMGSPRTAVETMRGAAGAARRDAELLTRRVGAVAALLTGRGSDRDSPITGSLSHQRRFVTVRRGLAEHRAVRDAQGGTVNDVVLATVAGGLRGWLMTRSESLAGVRRVRAVVPMSVLDQELEATSVGSQIAPHLVDLPVGEPSPVVRLHQVSHSFLAHQEIRRAVAANRIAGVPGFAPSTFHAIGSRVAAEQLRRGIQLSVTNVPGPQFPLYAAGAVMEETYPVPPLLPGLALAIGVTSYDGQVCYGVTADRDLVPDADTLASCLSEALDELLDASGEGRPRAPRGRRTRSTP
ncbi:MAG TPA: wax ester/triacylglycerol synthase family O-acyltransferase [Nocardioides sp.]|jgi:diacylglycerol O-acyltransferase|uniref:WS/DGAT/MGAT family O-acyltransferase n=1 Tax=Nocardioides sp. TaxID=35761 RepID=UPI002E33C543|nr:wax ester/triacylglycerol synthase family O-acyltransferase [Nocardioides sp.]HEX3932886.1 wax ester/triacylglycerol synthase family O-acyltransferase [Nocardioides sp.]